MSLRQRREVLGLTQQEVADRSGTSKEYYSQIETGRVKLPNPELRREVSRVLGLRHVDFLVEVGILDDWEIPGFSPNEPDPLREDLVTQLGQLDLSVDNRASTLSGILLMRAAQDRQRSPHRITAAPDEAGG